MVEQRGAAVVKVLHRLGFTNGPCLPCPVGAEVPPPLRGGWTLPRREEECPDRAAWDVRSEEHTSELQSLMRISYAVFCLKKKKNNITRNNCRRSIVNTV